MKLFEAINDMREATRDGRQFSFSFMSLDTTKGQSHGVVEVRHASLRKRAHSNAYRYADYTIEYYDHDNNQDRRFWLPLLMTYNNQIISE